MLNRFVSRESLILAICIWTIHALLEIWITDGFRYLTLLWVTHGFLLMLLLGAMLDRVLLIRSPIARIAVSTALAIAFAALQTALDLTVSFTIGENILHEIQSPPGIELSAANLAFQTAAKLTFKIYIWLFGFYAAILALLAAIRDIWQARLAVQHAQIEAMRLQINPHFLFNALASMEGLMTLGRTADATRMLHSLSDFYRSTLLDRDDNMTSLEEELELLQEYAAVERVRFGDRLRLTIEDLPDAGHVLVPPLLLQPLVENAIKHGDDGTSPSHVTIRVQLKADQIEILVTNPLRRSAGQYGTGTGLANVRRRLNLLYEDRAGLEAGPQNSEWLARVWLPMDSTKPPHEVARLTPS
ncbi:MAG: hypothetical protein EON91_03540 [Brevundimonas sp.]|uniref:sensor histidine kinase n=1 Tax=Brevundimonas sp. TaxID=1871086 RepID=UPI001201F1C6|nr:histidine kinase [Brevundimonas sp.]RZJ18843.1 MAG: hypothetical protein EON91_03540 [Brevundimonas sp.]